MHKALTYVCVCIHIPIYIYPYTYMHIHICICIYIYVYMYTYIYIYTNTHFYHPVSYWRDRMYIPWNFWNAFTSNSKYTRIFSLYSVSMYMDYHFLWKSSCTENSSVFIYCTLRILPWASWCAAVFVVHQQAAVFVVALMCSSLCSCLDVKQGL